MSYIDFQNINCERPSATVPCPPRHMTPVAEEDQPWAGIPRFADLAGMTRADAITRRKCKVLLLQAALAMMGDYRQWNARFTKQPKRPRFHGTVMRRKKRPGEL